MEFCTNSYISEVTPLSTCHYVKTSNTSCVKHYTRAGMRQWISQCCQPEGTRQFHSTWWSGVYESDPTAGVPSTPGRTSSGDTPAGRLQPATSAPVRRLGRKKAHHSGQKTKNKVFLVSPMIGAFPPIVFRFFYSAFHTNVFLLFMFFHSRYYISTSRFCVSVQRENFPQDPSSPPLPAHTLTILPPVTISNLLPCDLQVFLDHSRSPYKMVKRGKEICLYFVSTTLLGV